MSNTQSTRASAQDFSTLVLSPATFHAFYTKFVNLRFPIEVAHVLELRYLINHAVDRYREPPRTQDYLQFRESLQAAIDSFSIENHRHRDRLLTTLSLMRDIHYVHSIASRNAEKRLREAIAENRAERRRRIQRGSFCLIAGASFCLAWAGMPDPDWYIKVSPLVLALFAKNYLHDLPNLDHDLEDMTHELNDVLRRRVRSLNWKTLIHKLALVLGYKRIRGVEVFHIDSGVEHSDRQVYH